METIKWELEHLHVIELDIMKIFPPTLRICFVQFQIKLRDSLVHNFFP